MTVAKILIIDDSPELMEMLRLPLENRGGYETVLSTNGKEGLAKAFADPPDLAIIDVMMPGITGYEVCRRLRANPSTASMPIFILTARGQPVDREAALEAGADAYMTKPVRIEYLLERVDDLLVDNEPKGLPQPAKEIALLGLRGGVGVTTLAVNLAAALASEGKHGVCLVDLSPSSGHIALQLGMRPEPNWSTLLDSGVLDAETVEACLLQHNSGLQVLASPLVPLVEQDWSRRETQAMLDVLQWQGSFLVVDTPPMLSEATMAILEMAEVVGLVVTAEPPSIQTAVGALRVLKQEVNKVHVILNQVRPEAQLPSDALKRVLRRPMMGSVPFDPAQAQALTHGMPLTLSNPHSPLATAVQKLAQEVVGITRSA